QPVVSGMTVEGFTPLSPTPRSVPARPLSAVCCGCLCCHPSWRCRDAQCFLRWALRRPLRFPPAFHTSACLSGQSRAYGLLRRRGRVAEGGGLLSRCPVPL